MRKTQEGIELLDNIQYQRFAIFCTDQEGYLDWSNEISLEAYTLFQEKGWANNGPTLALFHQGLFYQREIISDGKDADSTALYRSFAERALLDQKEKARKIKEWESAIEQMLG